MAIIMQVKNYVLMDKRSRAAKSAEDEQVRKELKKMDRCAVIFYLISPVALAVNLGKERAGIIIPVIFLFSIFYIIAFNSFLKSFSSDDIRCIERLSRRYHAYSMSWLFLIFTSLIIINGLLKLTN